MISSETTVRDIAVQMPQATRLFEKLTIDYCCGGNRALKDACDDAGVETGEVLRMLEAVAACKTPDPDAVRVQTLSLTELVEHIVEKHHVYTKNEIARLNALTKKVISVHGENHPELKRVGQLFERLSVELTPHMFKEEQVLFPYVFALVEANDATAERPFAPFGTINNPIYRMMLEHDMAGEILRELRTVTSNYALPSDACISYRTLYEALEAFEKDLHQHIHLENNVLFPRAMQLETALSEQDYSTR